MPVLTMASAASRIRLSLTLHANLFQLFQPIGGVRAKPLSSANKLLPPHIRIVRKNTLLISTCLLWGNRAGSHLGEPVSPRGQPARTLIVSQRAAVGHNGFARHGNGALSNFRRKWRVLILGAHGQASIGSAVSNAVTIAVQ